MATIQVNWYYVNWDVKNKWGKDIVPQLTAHKITESQLERAVYVIRTNGNFAIDYPKKPSPTLYIGEGNFKQRLMQHKNWLKELRELVGDFPFEIALAIPLARHNKYMYKDMEADLLHEFKYAYGAAPFMNKQLEYHSRNHVYEPYQEFVRPLQIGKGKRIPWAIKPLPSNTQYNNFWKTTD